MFTCNILDHKHDIRNLNKFIYQKFATALELISFEVVNLITEDSHRILDQ